MITEEVAEATDSNAASWFFIAAQQNQPEIMQKLLANGANPNQARNNDGVTPLFIAAKNNRVEIVTLLLESGADINQANNNGVTPLSIAIANNRVEIVTLLLASGADINQANNNGVTPLFIAVANNRVEIVTLLLESGADINQADIDNATPFFIAAQEGHLDVINTLLEYPNIDINIPLKTTPALLKSFGEPLCSAIQERIDDYLSNYVNIDPDTPILLTPLDIATLMGQTAVVEKLTDITIRKEKTSNILSTHSLLASSHFCAEKFIPNQPLVSGLKR
jgi:ankyrin repeat protein